MKLASHPHERFSLVAILALCLVAIAQMGAAGGPPALTISTYATGFSSPIFITNAGDGSKRLFVAQQRGRIRIINEAGAVQATDFLNLSATGLNLVSTSGSERGLLGIAFHPNYRTTGRFFTSYTRVSDGASILSEWTVDSGNPDVIDTASERIIMGPITQPFSNHNGGWIAFSPADGYLYYALGDGGSADDPGNRAQNINNQLGKIHRIDVDSPPDAGLQYHVPEDNPFVGRDGLDEIYSYGVRNPWRPSFDRVTGAFWVADVGQDIWEEVSLCDMGDNMGWRLMEGAACFNPPTNCNNGSLKLPISTYDHNAGQSITGGYVYRGVKTPALQGYYLFADYVSGLFRAIEQTGPGTFQTHNLPALALNPSSFGEDECGEIYIAGHGNGTIYRIVGPQQPGTIVIDPDPLEFTVVEGEQLSEAILNIHNAGQATLNYTLSDDLGFLTFSRTSGLVECEAEEIGVLVDTTGMTPGTYSGSVTVTAPGATNSPVTRGFSLIVEAAGPLGTITADPDRVEISVLEGEKIAPFIVAIGNSGDTRYSGVASTDSKHYTLEPTKLDVENGGRPVDLTMTFRKTPPVGLHESIITITADGVTNSPFEIPVSINVTAPKTEGFVSSIASIELSVDSGVTPDPIVFQLNNNVGRTISFTTQRDGEFFTVDPDRGDIEDSTPIDVTVSFSGPFQTGDNVGSISFLSKDAPNSPLIIPITVTVAPPPIEGSGVIAY